MFNVALWGSLMGIGEELDLFLQVLKGGLEVCCLLLMTVLSGPDSGDEALGHSLSRSGLVISFSFLPLSPTYSPCVLTLLFVILLCHASCTLLITRTSILG